MSDPFAGIMRGEEMSRSDNSSLATRASLLDRLKSLEDQASWQVFFDTYWQLIHCVARKAGLTEAEAEDVVQETVISAAKHLPGFHYDPKVCSFKTWLLRLTRWRIIDQLRKRLPVGQCGDEAMNEDDATATALLDRLTGGASPDLEGVWSTEWQKFILAEAIERLKRRVTPEQFQIFDLYALRGMPIAKVASLLRVSTARIYLTKHRVGKLLKAELKELDVKM
jgi:RNA polymerase sigma-70 factor (ECF subfamily)